MNDDEQMSQIMSSALTVVKMVNSGADTLDLEKSALIALYAIRQHAPLRPSTVAGACGLDPSTISRHLKTLEDNGMVQRAPDPADRRAQLLSLTDAGAEFLGSLDELRLRRLEEAIGDWTGDERENLRIVLGRLADSLVIAGARRMAGLTH